MAYPTNNEILALHPADDLTGKTFGLYQFTGKNNSESSSALSLMKTYSDGRKLYFADGGVGLVIVTEGESYFYIVLLLKADGAPSNSGKVLTNAVIDTFGSKDIIAIMEEDNPILEYATWEKIEDRTF